MKELQSRNYDMVLENFLLLKAVSTMKLYGF